MLRANTITISTNSYYNKFKNVLLIFQAIRICISKCQTFPFAFLSFIYIRNALTRFESVESFIDKFSNLNKIRPCLIFYLLNNHLILCFGYCQ